MPPPQQPINKYVYWKISTIALISIITNPFIQHIPICSNIKRQFTTGATDGHPACLTIHRCELCRYKFWTISNEKLWCLFPKQTGWKIDISSLSMEEEEEQILDPPRAAALWPKFWCRRRLQDCARAARACLGRNFCYCCCCHNIRVGQRPSWQFKKLAPTLPPARAPTIISPDVSSHNHCDSSCLLPWLCFYKINFRKTPKQRF